MNNGKRTGGGSATASGALFQSAASAWYCVGILAERDFPAPLGLPANTTLKFIRCETDEPVDDLLVITSDDGLIFAQAKHTLSLEESSESDLASAIDQCTRQYLANRSVSQPRRTWNRPLVAHSDRLVIIVGDRSSAPIKNDVPAVLENIRTLGGRPLDDASRNAEQQRVLSVLRAHCSAAWRKASGSDPTDVDLVALLSLLRVQVLGLEPDGAEERHARTLLRTSVLREATSDSKTWELLGRFCQDLAANRRGADRHVLQRFLLEKQIDLEAPRSYRADIEKLKQHTKTSLTLLRDLAVLRVGDQTFSIERRCTSAAVDAAMNGSLLITGDPGSGKSGLLYWLTDQCQRDGTDCVVLLVDRIASSSLGELRRDLGLEHEVHEVLQNWPALKPAILLVDALDAAREDRAAKAIRDLIQLALASRERWNVVATIRKFDLRYSEELKELFRGSPPASPRYADGVFKGVRHLNVPVLDDAELMEIARNSRPLGDLLTEASSSLKELLRNAFNVRLAADLVTSGLTVADFTAIRTQLELLERYWRYRVLGTGADEREQLLRSASEAMVGQRSLRVDRKTIAAQGGPALDTLLSRNVLVEWQRSEGSLPNRYILSYSHHVLHDYAIARLLLRGDKDRLLARLSSDIDFALVARPSISMHFHYLWADSPPEFWQLSFDVLGLRDAPKILQLVGANVAAESFTAADDASPLCQMLTSQAPGVAPQFFTHLVGSIVTLNVPLVGAQARPWWPFLLRLSESLTLAIAFPLQSLLGVAVDRSSEATPDQLQSLGRVARALLQFAWAHSSDVSSMVWVGVQGVCRSLAVNPAGREEIKRIIDPVRVRTLGYLEVPWLAHEIAHIIDADPDLALDIYRAAFEHEEPSEEPTQMSKSRILPLTSNKRQDYEMALWELGEKYEYFLEKAPLQATIALTCVLSSYIRRRHRYGESNQHPDQTFEFRGRAIELHDDGSEVWDSGGVYSNDDGVKILDAFAEYILSLSQRNERARLEQALDLLVANKSSAVIWRRLLLIASQDGGETITPLVAPLLLNSTLLLAPDIGYAAGEFLRLRANALDEELRGRIEDVLLALVDGAPNREYTEYKRAQLIGCLPLEAIVREPMRALSAQLKAEGGLPENKPAFSIRTERDTEESHLRELGVQTETPETRRLLKLWAPLREFSSKFLNEDPADEDVRAIYPSISAVHEALAEGTTDPAAANLIDRAWGYLAAACAAVAHAKGFSCDSDVGRAVATVLIEAAANKEPTFNEPAEIQFNQRPSWGSPAARIDAAKGLALLGQYRDCLSEDLRATIRKLSRDPVAAVRFQIATTLLAFYSTEQFFFWDLSRSFAEQESNRGVLSGVVRSIGQVVRNHLDDAIALLLSIRSRVAPTSADPSEVRRSIDSLIAQAYVYRDHAPSEQHLRALLATIGENAAALEGTLHYLRNALTYREDQEDDTAVRARTFALFLDMLRAAQQALEDLEANHTDPFEAWPQADQQSAKGLNELVRGVSDQVYFASGAFDEKKKDDSQDADSKQRSRRFYSESGALLDELTNVKIAAASHHLIETLAFFVAEDPQGVFLRVAKSVQSARVGGYQYESLGAKQVVTLVERYIAEYRSLFQEETFRWALMAMLDTFVEAGWPSARGLVYRLDEIFR